MRTLLVCHRYPPDARAGVERITQTLADNLRRGGDDVTVLTRRADGSEPLRLSAEVDANGIDVRRIVGGALHLSVFLDRHEQIERFVSRTIVETAPDVVHAVHLLGLTPRLVEIAHRQRTPVVLSLQDFYFACPRVHLEKPWGELCDGPDGGRACAATCFAGDVDAPAVRWVLRAAYFRRVLRLADRVISPSRHVADYFEAFGLDPRRSRVIPNGAAIDAAGRPKRPRRPGQLKIAYLGTVVAHKGVHVVLDAIRLASLSHVELLALGEAPDEAYTARLRATARGIAGLEFALYGAYELQDLTRLLADVDLVVIPSQVPESFSITAREALARGIPILASRLGALPEAVDEGVNGFTFEHDRPVTLAALLRRLDEEQGLLERLGRGAGDSRVASLADHARMVRAVYDEAIDEQRHGQRPLRADYAELAALYSELLASGAATTGEERARAAVRARLRTRS